MPSLIDMRRRIRAVKSTQQITKAMKMVAASKLRRAQERVMAARPFAETVQRVRASVASRVDQTRHPLLQRRPGAETGPTLVIAITSDRGLCGSFNQNVVKAVGGFIRENPGRPISLGLVGRKGRDLLYRRGLPVRLQYVNLPKVIGIADAETIAEPAIADFVEGKVDSVYLVYNEFKSVMQQQIRVASLLPLAPIGEQEAAAAAATTAEYIYEPSPQEIFDVMLHRIVEIQILHAMLESTAGFYAAQMTAMDAATRNSAEMIDNLTLTMNKVRQAQITREIIEVVSGAEAL
jgi:F-type H+-transporting ATPase subunit gamma